MPKQHLTDRFIKTLQPEAGRIEYYDQHLISAETLKRKGVKGLLLRLTEAGNKYFYYNYWYDGKAKKYKIGDYPNISLSEARDKARELAAQVNKGLDPQTEKHRNKSAKPTTLKQAVDAYKDRHLPKLKSSTRDDYTYRIKHIIKGQGKSKQVRRRGFDPGRYIKDIARYEVLDFLDDIARSAPVQAQRMQAILSGIFKFAKNRGWIDANIASEINLSGKRKKTGNKWQNTAFDDQQIKDLWAAFDQHAEPAGSLFKILLILGQRAGETRLMKWTNIDFDKQLWTIPETDTKNGLEHYVPLPKMALDLLDHLKPGSSPYVFESPVKKGQPVQHQQKAAQRIRDTYKISDFNIHSLRTTAATRMAGLGVPPQVLSKILNHKKPGEGSTITAIYNQYDYEDEKKQALQRWSAHLQNILSGETEAKITRMG